MKQNLNNFAKRIAMKLLRGRGPHECGHPIPLGLTKTASSRLMRIGENKTFLHMAIIQGTLIAGLSLILRILNRGSARRQYSSAAEPEQQGSY